MTTIEVLAGPVGEGGRDDERDVKLVRRLLDDGRAGEAGDPGGRPLPVDGPMEPDTRAAIRAFRAWSGADPDGRVEPADLAWDALAAYHLAGVRSGRVRPDNLAFVPRPRAARNRPGRRRRRQFGQLRVLGRDQPRLEGGAAQVGADPGRMRAKSGREARAQAETEGFGVSRDRATGPRPARSGKPGRHAQSPVPVARRLRVQHARRVTRPPAP
jgi:peptidoglycan hydrolase-like protein with peptidoglycan-binding domain